MKPRDSAVTRFMNFTGKTGAFFGPAERSSSNADMTDDSKALLAQQEQDAQQWEIFTDASGHSYVVARK